MLFLLRFLLLLFFFSSFSFLSADHELVHGRSQELLEFFLTYNKAITLLTFLSIMRKGNAMSDN
jgi:hypothetical protein